MPLDFASLKAEYASLIRTVVVDTDPHKVAAINALVTKIIANQDTYKQVMKRVNDMPWQAIAAIHAMEKSCDFTCHLHNGDPLTARTTHVPSGRPPTGSPPFDWVESALDALTMPKHFLDKVKDWPIERVAFELEKYNGFGYRLQHTGVNTPYLFAWTNHHSKGRFIADHVFDANATSRQPGAMAVLKALADRGFGIDNAGGGGGGGGGGGDGGVDGTVTAKTKQLETGLFLPAGSFELLPTGTSLPSDDPDFANLIDPGLRCKKLGEVGQNWEIEVQSEPKRRGFARGGIFSPIVLDGTVDIDGFAQLCLTAARHFQTSAHHLVAVADTETGIRNVAADQGDGAGPFLITEADWSGLLNGTGLTAQQRFEPLAQPFIAAKAAAADAGVLQPALPNRLPTSAELFLAHLIGAAHAVKVLSNPAVAFQTAVSNEIGAAAFATLSAVRPWLFGAPGDVKSAMEKIARRMDFGYERADGLFKRIEPDTPIESAAGFAGKLCAMASAEWNFFGKNTLNLDGHLTHAGHREAEPGFFERIGTYWQKLGFNFDGRTNKPWSAAFISFAVKGCGAGSRFHENAQHSVYISQAIRDLNDKADVAYWCHRLTDHKPKAGDIICWARESGVDYDHQKNGDYAGHTDIVVEVRSKEIDVIGGNVGNSVTKRTFALDANGFVKGGTFQGELLFAIMENRLP
jgi:lysozyme family protein